MTTIAVMQPYFFPYAGYYRLLAAADVFVLFDCVQFPRRGWVHRNKLPSDNGETQWLTLPLEKADYHANINEIRFAPNAQAEFLQRCQSFPSLRRILESTPSSPLVESLLNFEGTPVEYLERTLQVSAEMLGVSPCFKRSSSLNLKPEIKGSDRVIAAAQAFGATHYVNLSGGKSYYEPRKFAHHNMELKIFLPHDGSYDSMLSRLVTEPLEAISSEISANLAYETHK